MHYKSFYALIIKHSWWNRSHQIKSRKVCACLHYANRCQRHAANTAVRFSKAAQNMAERWRGQPFLTLYHSMCLPQKNWSFRSCESCWKPRARCMNKSRRSSSRKVNMPFTSANQSMVTQGLPQFKMGCPRSGTRLSGYCLVAAQSFHSGSVWALHQRTGEILFKGHRGLDRKAAQWTYPAFWTGMFWKSLSISRYAWMPIESNILSRGGCYSLSLALLWAPLTLLSIYGTQGYLLYRDGLLKQPDIRRQYWRMLKNQPCIMHGHPAIRKQDTEPVGRRNDRAIPFIQKSGLPGTNRRPSTEQGNSQQRGAPTSQAAWLRNRRGGVNSKSEHSQWPHSHLRRCHCSLDWNSAETPLSHRQNFPQLKRNLPCKFRLISKDSFFGGIARDWIDVKHLSVHGAITPAK